MGFFTDLKDDLSQAVNELMPEEELSAAAAAESRMDAQAAQEQTVPADGLGALDISGMLDKIEEMGEVELSAAPKAEPAAKKPAVKNAVVPEPIAEEPVIEEPAVEMPMAEEELIEEEEAEPAMEVMAAAEVEAPVVEKEKIQNNGKKGKTMEEQANRVAVDETAVVTEGMTITGDIVSQGSMELIGTVNGNIDILGKLNITGTIQGNSKAAEIYAEGAKIAGEINSQGSVKIGQSSVVIGNITATSAVVAGAVKGDIDVQGPVILDTTAIVMGNIKSKSVQINNGAVIEGMCSQCYADVNPTSFFEEFKKKK